MRKIVLTTLLAVLAILGVQAQEHAWSFGLYSDVSLSVSEKGSNEEARPSEHATTFGLLAKYDFSKRSAVQSFVHGRSDLVSVGADYIVTVLDKTKSDFNVYLGGGFSQDFYGETTNSTDLKTRYPATNYSVVNGQAGISYYFSPVKLSLFSGYKLKHILKDIDGNKNSHYLTVGVRYHLW